jgi:ADP-ribose pyrophosphatase YjhB (NUDIX family)
MTTDSAPLPEPRFCHQCGAAVTLRHIEEEHRDRLACDNCGFIHYLNPRVVANVIPERRDGAGAPSLLLMRRALEPRRGFWTPPGGFVELGESTEEAAVREAQEEIGMTVAISGLVGVYSRPAVGIVVVAYRGAAQEDDATPGEEALETRWFTAGAIPWDDLAFETTVRSLRDWLALA